MYNAVMVSIQVRDVPEQVRDTLAEVARSRGQSMQAYLLALLEEDARRARNVMLLRQVRETVAVMWPPSARRLGSLTRSAPDGISGTPVTRDRH